MKTRIFIAFILYSQTLLFAHANTYRMSPEKGQVTFLAKGKPALILIKGEGEGISSTLMESNGSLKGEIHFNLASLKTGIELRDKHLKDKYLEVEKYPVARLTIEELKLPNNLSDPFEFNLPLQLHGITKNISGNIQLEGEGYPQKLVADFKIKLSLFQIDIPSFKGLTVAEDVQINVTVPIEKVN